MIEWLVKMRVRDGKVISVIPHNPDNIWYRYNGYLDELSVRVLAKSESEACQKANSRRKVFLYEGEGGKD